MGVSIIKTMINENEIEEVVKACSKWREAKLQIELEKQLKKKPEEYTNQEECEKAGYYWYDGKCHAEAPEKKSAF